MTSEDILVEDLEHAIERYMGVKEFPTGEWPKIAELLGNIITRAYVFSPSGFEASNNAKGLVEALGELAETVSRVMT